MMMQICSQIPEPIELTVIGIEADPEYIPYLKVKYEAYPRVGILNFAIAGKHGTVKLYRSASTDGEGNSIYPTKNNVSREDFVEVQAMPLSYILRALDPIGYDLKILKTNIEGAELEMIQDLIATDSHGLIDIFCGATSDIHKVAELSDQQEQYHQMLKDAGIDWQLFHDTYKPRDKEIMMANMRLGIMELLSISPP